MNPSKVTPAQMDRQARDFDNWAICDTLCFALWVRTPHAFAKIRQWAGHRDEFVKRAAFALLASVALKDKTATDAQFLRCLPLIAKAARDERNFVKKGVNWALRGVGERSPALNKAAIALANKLAAAQRAGATLDRQGRAAPARERGHAAPAAETSQATANITTEASASSRYRGLAPDAGTARLARRVLPGACARRSAQGLGIIREEWAVIQTQRRCIESASRAARSARSNSQKSTRHIAGRASGARHTGAPPPGTATVGAGDAAWW